MSELGNNLPVSGVGGSSPAGSPEKTSGAKEGSGAAFEALLEKLEQRAVELSEDSREELEPERLAGAVDRARASLEDALSLGDRLLEAYREAAQQSQNNDGEEPR